MDTEIAEAADTAANANRNGASTDANRRWSRAARQSLYASCLPALRSWTLRRFARCGIHDADDLVQIALLRALHRLEDFEVRGDGSFLGYLRQIVLNEARREWQRQRQRGETVEIDESVWVDHDPVFDAMLDRERDRAYAAALDHLSQRQRAHLSLRIEHGLTFNEIAREVGSSADAARMLVARALRTMNAQLAAA